MKEDERPPIGVHTDARIEEERGRFVVYLDTLMVTADGKPAGVRTTRINDYPDKNSASVAAKWMERSARRQSDDPTGH
ncbi:MAG: hypothetical protein AAGG01_00980 [Planctomycetota bacterium]